MKRNNLPLIFSLLLITSYLILSGCVNKEKSNQDEFFKEWQTKAETSQPYLSERKDFSEISTPGSETLSSVETTRLPSENLAQKEKELMEVLPSQPVSVRFVDDKLPTVLRTLARLADQNILLSPSVQGTINTHIINTPWNKVFMSLINSYGLIVTNEDNLLHVMSLEDMKQQIDRKSLQIEEEQISPLITKIVGIEYSDPEEIATKSIPLLLSKDKGGKTRGSVSFDDHSRSIVIRDTEENMTKLLKLVHELDKPTPQILIKAHIVETSKDTARALGVKWGALANSVLGDSRINITPGSSSQYSPQSGRLSPFEYQKQYEDQNMAAHAVVQQAEAIKAAADGEIFIPTPFEREVTYENIGSNLDFSVPGATLGLLFSGKTLILDAQLSALQTAGKLNILSSPSISTLDNIEAIIESGTSIPVPSGVDDNGNIIYTQTSATLKLTVKPHVISSEEIKLDIKAQKDEIASVENGLPRLLKKNATTKLIVPNNATVVIAGLTKEINTASEQGVPYLKDIPILGKLFQEKSKSNQFEDLLIFITPTILTKPTD